MRVCKGRAAVRLVRRIREGCQRTALAVELRAHVGATARLVGSLSEVRARRVWHLSLVARLGVSAATAALVRVATASRSVTHVVAHVAVGRLGGLATQVLRAGTERSLWCRAHLCEQRVRTVGIHFPEQILVRSRPTRHVATRAPSKKKRKRKSKRCSTNTPANCTAPRMKSRDLRCCHQTLQSCQSWERSLVPGRWMAADGRRWMRVGGWVRGRSAVK